MTIESALVDLERQGLKFYNLFQLSDGEWRAGISRADDRNIVSGYGKTAEAAICDAMRELNPATAQPTLPSILD